MAERDADIEILFEPGAEQALAAYLQLLHPADIAQLFNLVDDDHWKSITHYLSPEILAEVLVEVDENQRATLGDILQTSCLVAAVDELETDDAADVIADLPDDKSRVVLNALEDRKDIQKLLTYPEDSAGGIMQTELCRVQEGDHVTDAIEAVRKTREDVDDVLEVYVVDKTGRLTGTVALEDLVLSKERTNIDTIQKPVEHKVTPVMDQEEVAYQFGKYDLYTLPVVDEQGKLLGRITYDDIHDVLEEEASEDIMASVGASSEDLVYSSHFFRIAMFRLPWLITSLFGSVLTGYLLSLFGHFTKDAIILASFVPVVMAMTGNIGSQSAMIVTRGLAIGKVDIGTIGRTFFRELSVGLIMGMISGVLVGLLGYLWQGKGLIGLAVGLSMISSMSIASAVGAGAPALFKKLGIDPAIASGPLVTTGCDFLGVAIYLLIALGFVT